MRRVLLAAVAALVIAPAAQPWTWPADGPVLRPFILGEDPYTGGRHRGLDVGGDVGAAVRAPASGAVSFTGTVPGGGKTISIRTADGYTVTLLQLGTIGVQRGAIVEEGTVVGSIGPSGDPVTLEPHVHLGIRVTAEEHGYVDPLSLLPARAAPAPPAAVLPEPIAAPPATAPLAPRAGEPAPQEPAPVEAPTPEPAPAPELPPAAAAASAAEVPADVVDPARSGPVAEAPAATAEAGPSAPEGVDPSTESLTDPPAVAGPATPLGPPSASATEPPATSAETVASVSPSGGPVEDLPAMGRSTVTTVTAPDVSPATSGSARRPAVPADARAAERRPARPAAAVQPRRLGPSESRATRSASAPPLRQPVRSDTRTVPRLAGRHDARPTGLGVTAGDGSDPPGSHPPIVLWLTSLTATAAAIGSAAAAARRRAQRPARIMGGDGRARSTEDPRRGGVALCERAAPHRPRGRLRCPGGHLRALPQAEGERRPDGQRHGRARDAGDGDGRQGGELAA